MFRRDGTENSTKLLRQNYRNLKDCGMSLEELIQTAVLSNSFENHDSRFVKGYAETLKMGCFWKRLLRKGANKCSAFLDELIRKTDRTFVENIIQDQALENPPECALNISRDVIQRERQYICREINLSTSIVDILFEKLILSFDEHDSIEEIDRRGEQREKLLQILLDKPASEWVSGFVQALEITNHNNLIEHLRNPANTTSGNHILLSHTTYPYGSTQPINFSLELDGNRSDDGGFQAVVSGAVGIQEVLQESIAANIVQLRESCIFIHLSTYSPDILRDILNGRDNKKMKQCIQVLFERNKSLIEYFAKDTVVAAVFRELPISGFVTDEKEEDSQIDNEGSCIECYQETIRKQFQEISDEIEDDIINDTMTSVNEKRKRDRRLQKEKTCFFNIKSRQEKAVRFLQYVLYNRDAILAFVNVFGCKSRVHLKKELCRKCTGIIEKEPQVKERKFYFKVMLDQSGAVEVYEVDETESLPENQRNDQHIRLDI